MAEGNKLGLKGKTLVYGLGLTGLAVAKDLSARGVKVLGWDDHADARAAAERDGLKLATRKQLEAFTAGGKEGWKGVGALVKSPGIPLGSRVVRNALAAGVPLLSDFDLLWRREKGRGTHFIGITGTNGKSTTTALVGHVLRNAGVPVAVGGNIGAPALGLPELPEGGFYVLEMSSFQLEMMGEMQVDAALLLNLTPDHLDRHGDMPHYLAAKRRLFDLAKQGAVKVLGVDQEPLRALAQASSGRGGFTTVSLTGQEADYNVTAEGELWRGASMVGDVSVFERMPGAHNWQNIACAYVLLKGLGGGQGVVSDNEFLMSVQTFRGLPHRLERVRDIAIGGRSVGFINDSKATNGDSAVPALKSFADIYWICGGRPKSDGLEAVLKSGVLAEVPKRVRAAFTIGEAARAFAVQLRGAGVQTYDCGTMEKAVADAYAAARQSDAVRPVVLLSPACASYDQFRNYEQRGEVFAKIVRGIQINGSA